MFNNTIEYKVYGDLALFTDPLTKGGENFSYQVPTYEALKGITKNIYWKPTITWYIDKVRIMKPFSNQTVCVKNMGDGTQRRVSYYTYLKDVEYQVRAYFEFNKHRPEFMSDRNVAKHHDIAQRSVKKGGRMNICLGSSECYAYIEPVKFGDGDGAYDHIENYNFGIMFHSFNYPDETGVEMLSRNFDNYCMKNGVIHFKKPEDCTIRENIYPMTAKTFNTGTVS